MVDDTDNPALGRLKRKAGEPAPVGAARCARLLRLAGRFAAVGLALVIALVPFMLAAHRLAQRDIGSAGGQLLQAAEIAAHDQLLILGVGLFAAGALLGAAQNSMSPRPLKLTRQRQMANLYTKALEQLGSDRLDVRIAGTHALESVARDSARYHSAVMEVLTAFIREHSRIPLRRPDPDGLEQEQWVQPDVQAALTAVARRKHELDVRRIDLTGAYLNCAGLHGATLDGAELGGADLAGADLTKTRLRRAILHDADLRTANLRRADLTRADLIRANLAWACLADANLTHARLTDANLAHADVTGARWPPGAPVPEGWKRNASRLRRAGAGSGPARANQLAW
jgi:uncharacterized protein YjbI with pentapeptide repeats